MMKRHVALKKLKRKCVCCDKEFVKGDIYYKKRNVYINNTEVQAFEYLMCPKCNYTRKDHDKRHKLFIIKCPHPRQMFNEVWSYIPGEAIKQPDHVECLICGTIL